MKKFKRGALRTASGIVAGFLVAAGLMAGPVMAAPADAPDEETVTLVNRDQDGYTPQGGSARDGVIRFDVEGNAIDAHDGQILRYGDMYYLYGTTYGCGFQWQAVGSEFCGVSVYSSPDLVNWQPHAPLFDASTAQWQERCGGTTYGCFRPHVAYNAKTDTYVMWLNVYDNVVGYRVFTSDSPLGPFAEVAEPTLAAPQGAEGGVNYGDHQIFVDDDGSAYLAYTDWLRGGDIIVEKLNDEYTSGSGELSRVNLRSTEAPTIFERDGTYYLTYSDPNRGYQTTGTAYVTASSPLGPWTGTSAASDGWTIEDGALQIEGGGVGLARDGEEWGDVIIRANVTMRQAKNGDYSQFGIAFGGGYQWLIGNYGHAAAPGGNLTKIRPNAAIEIVKTPNLLTVGQTLDVEIRAVGDTITTSIDGQVFDTTARTTAFSGRMGFRQDVQGGERVTVNDVSVTDVNGTVLLTDDFSQGLKKWDRGGAIITGTNITTTSCGGQPTDVLPIETSTGMIYLYQSDVWSDGQKSSAGQGNQAVAKHFWQPLEFNAEGGIMPIDCDARTDVTIPVGPALDLPTRGAISSGDDEFLTHWDIAGGRERAQTFTATEDGTLSAVRFTAFQRDRPIPTGPLEIELRRLTGEGVGGETIQRLSVPQADVSYAASWIELTLDDGVKASAGDRFAIVVSTSSANRAYGFAYSDTSSFPGGEALISQDGGATWSAEQGRVLHFEADFAPVDPGEEPGEEPGGEPGVPGDPGGVDGPGQPAAGSGSNSGAHTGGVEAGSGVSTLARTGADLSGASAISAFLLLGVGSAMWFAGARRRRTLAGAESDA